MSGDHLRVSPKHPWSVSEVGRGHNGGAAGQGCPGSEGRIQQLFFRQLNFCFPSVFAHVQESELSEGCLRRKGKDLPIKVNSDFHHANSA